MERQFCCFLCFPVVMSILVNLLVIGVVFKKYFWYILMSLFKLFSGHSKIQQQPFAMVFVLFLQLNPILNPILSGSKATVFGGNCFHISVHVINAALNCLKVLIRDLWASAPFTCKVRLTATWSRNTSVVHQFEMLTSLCSSILRAISEVLYTR